MLENKNDINEKLKLFENSRNDLNNDERPKELPDFLKPEKVGKSYETPNNQDLNINNEQPDVFEAFSAQDNTLEILNLLMMFQNHLIIICQ